MKITKEQLNKLINGLVKEQFADWELGLGENPDEYDQKFPFPDDPDLHDNDLEGEDDLYEQLEWSEDEVSSFGNDAEESEEWFSNFTGELTGIEDDEDNTEPVPDQPWDEEYVGRADEPERFVQEAKKKKHKSPSEKVRKPVAPPSRKHKDPMKYDRKRDKKDVDLNEMRPMNRQGSMMQGKGEEVIKRFVEKHLIAVANSLGGKGGKWGRVDEEVKNGLRSALRRVALEAYGELDV